MRCTALALAAATLIAAPATAQVADFTELPINGFYCDREGAAPNCGKMITRIEEDNRKAWKGDYQGQRNVAFCLSDGCEGLLLPNRSLACAWRIIIIGSGTPRVDSTDIANLKQDCGHLDAAQRSAAQAQASAIFRAVYKREFGPVSW